jgi:hypothetical protein
MNTLVAYYNEAKTKVTTYVALAIAGLAQLTEHSQDAYSSWPEIANYLPQSIAVKTGHYVLSALGLLVVYTRVRRLVSKT